jgi:hypothetical protein
MDGYDGFGVPRWLSWLAGGLSVVGALTVIVGVCAGVMWLVKHVRIVP